MVPFIRRATVAGALSLAIFHVSSAAAYDGVCRDSSDLEELPPRHWCAVQNSHLESAEKRPEEYADWDGNSSASYDSYQRNFGVGGITVAWNGGAFDSKRDRLIIWGGGHNAYGGNEIYAFDLRTLKWERLTDPTVFPNRSPATENDDGTPISRHTYSGLAYVSHTDEFFGMGGAPDSAGGGCGVEGTWLFDFSAVRWRRMRPSGEVPLANCEDNAIYDPVNRQVLYYNRGIHAYDREANSFRLVSDDNLAHMTSLAIDTARKLLVQVGENPNLSATRVADLTNLSGGFRTLSTSGAKALESEGNPGLAYDETSDRIVGWYGGGTIYSLDLDTNAWTAHSPASGNKATPPLVTTSGGVYGRFQYAPSLNVFVVVNRVDEPVYIYRLSEGTGIPNDRVVPAPPVLTEVK